LTDGSTLVIYSGAKELRARDPNIAFKCAIAGNVAAASVLDEYRAGQHVDRILDAVDKFQVSLLANQLLNSSPELKRNERGAKYFFMPYNPTRQSLAVKSFLAYMPKDIDLLLRSQQPCSDFI
jgi:hypothetical protein